MAYREYKFGTMMIATLFVVTLSITILFPTLQMAKIPPTATAVQKAKDYGTESGWTAEPNTVGLSPTKSAAVGGAPKYCQSWVCSGSSV